MIPINTLSQYKEAVAAAKGAGFRLTNCYFLPQALTQKIEGGKLFLEPIPGGLLILEDEGSFLRCFYYLSDRELPQPLRPQRELVLEYPYREPLEETDALHLRAIEELGFRRSRRSAQLTAAAAELRIPETAPADTASASDAEGILTLLQATFDPRYAYFPTEQALLASIAAGDVWVVREGETPIAVLCSCREKQYAQLQHLAVAPEYRGRGIAARLLAQYHRHYRQSVLGFRHWVDTDNAPAIALYQRFGYRFGIRRADEYIIHKEEPL